MGTLMRTKDKLPEIMYEEPRYEGDPVSQIPFIEVGLDDEMPQTLVVFEYKETGETEEEEVSVFTDDSMHRRQKQGIYGFAASGFGCLDARKAIALSF